MGLLRQTHGETISRWMNTVRTYFSRKSVSPVLLVMGGALLLYVAGEYWAMYRSQRNLEAEWERQSAAVSETVSRRPALREDQMLTRIVVPKINVDSIVVEGVSRRELSAGPGHMKQTAIPGEIGNAVITAHRDTFFRHIYELNPGDQIQVRRGVRTFTFTVTGKKVVVPDDISVIQPTSDAQLTLITCYPTYYIGPAPRRLVVFSRLVDSGQPQPGKQTAQAHGSEQ